MGSPTLPDLYGAYDQGLYTVETGAKSAVFLQHLHLLVGMLILLV